MIRPDGVAEVVETRTDLASMRALIGGGWLEGVGATIESSWHAYCDEDGKNKGLPMNPVATVLAQRLGWPTGDVLCGTVVFLGTDGPHEADVPDEVLAEHARLSG